MCRVTCIRQSPSMGSNLQELVLSHNIISRQSLGRQLNSIAHKRMGSIKSWIAFRSHSSADLPWLRHCLLYVWAKNLFSCVPWPHLDVPFFLLLKHRPNPAASVHLPRLRKECITTQTTAQFIAYTSWLQGWPCWVKEKSVLLSK